MRGIAGQGVAHHAALAVDHVEHAGGQSGVLQGAGQVGGGERGELGRLDDHGVAADQRRGGLPGRDGDGEVPRRDEPDDAESLAAGGDGGVRQAAGQHLAGGGPAERAEEPQHVRGALDLALGLGEGLAFLADEVPGDRGLAVQQEVAGGHEDGAAGGGGQGGPGRLRGGGGADGGVDVGRGAAGGERRELAGAGRVHTFGVGLAEPFAVDEVPGGDEVPLGGGGGGGYICNGGSHGVPSEEWSGRKGRSGGARARGSGRRRTAAPRR